MSLPTTKLRLAIHSALLPCLLGAAAAAVAQAPPPPPPPEVEVQQGGLEEVIVTANKRSENMQDVPIAISALTADEAGKIGVVNGQTLAQVIPGLQLNRQTNGSTPFLRGVGNPSTQAGTEPAVAMYVDDVYYGSSAAALSNYNSISRIEVLRGPQGTLFGRNATGGVISVFTKDPTPEPALDVSLGYGNYDTISGNLYASGGLGDNLSANIALYGEDQNDGWGTNFTTGNDAYVYKNYGGRIKLLWDVGEDTSVLFNVDYDDYENQQAVFFRPAPGTRSNAGALSDPPPDLYDSFENLDPTAAVEMYGASAKVKHEFDFAEFVSISAYRWAEAEQHFAQDGASIHRLNPLLMYETDTWTQEFQLLSPADSRISWVGGLFYLNDSSTVDPFHFTGFLTTAAIGIFDPALLGDAFRGAGSEQSTESWSAFFQTTVPITDQFNITAGIRYTDDERSMSGFRINGTPDGTVSPRVYASNSGLSDSWSSVTGRLALDYQFTDDFMAYVAWNRGFKSGLFNTIIPPDFGPNILAPGVPTIDPPVEPEDIDAYTLGFKSELIDNTLRLNAEAFYYKYENLQLQQVLLIPGGGTTTRLTNAAKATLQGIDIDLLWQPTSQLSITAAVEFVDGEYDDFPDGQYFVHGVSPGATVPVPIAPGTPNAGGNCVFTVVAPPAPAPCGAAALGALPPNYDPATGHWNLEGNETIQTPPFSATLTVDYTVPMTAGDLGFTVNYSHSGDYFFDADNGLGQISAPNCSSCSSPENNHQDEFDIINASITWYGGDDDWSVRLWGKNLTDEEYVSFGNETGTITKKTPAPPLTYGVTFNYHF